MTQSLNWDVLIVGVAGGSGSGKTTFARSLQAQWGADVCGILSQDAYYRDMHEYFDRDGGQVNFDHPDALEFELMVEHLRSLRRGRQVEVPLYDFATHRRLPEAQPFPSRRVVVVDGIFLLTQSEVREQLDFAFFIDTPESLRLDRRLRRDVRERGRTPEGVLRQFQLQVKPMHDLFVEPTRQYADVVVSGESDFSSAVQGHCALALSRATKISCPF